MTVEFRSAYPMPDQIPPEPVAVFLDADRFNYWLDELEEEPVKRLQRLHALVAELNGTALPSVQRMALLEAIEARLEHSLSDIKMQLAASRFPPQQDDLALAVELQGLNQALIVGYDSVTLSSRYEANSEMTGQSLRKSMALLRQSLFCAALLYQPPPPQTWLELHRLYDFAESAGLARDDADAIADIYRQTLLFSAAGPQRLNREELFGVYDLLPTWSKHTRITAPYLESESSLLIPADADQPPAPAAPGQGNRPGIRRKLDITNLIRHLRLSITHRASKSNDARASRSHAGVLRRVIQSVGAPAKREFFRLPGNLGLNVTIGLDAILATLNDAVVDEAAAQHLSVINESATGYCVSADEGMRIAIGELLGIRLAENPTVSIGVARWLQSGGREGPRLGIEVLANSAEVVQTALSNQPENLAALLLPEITATGQLQTLILPAGAGSTGARVAIDGGRTVTLATAIESTPTFDQFTLL